MTHEEWLDLLKNKYDRFGNGIIDGHYDILRNKCKFACSVLDENSNHWIIFELAIRDKKK